MGGPVDATGSSGTGNANSTAAGGFGGLIGQNGGNGSNGSHMKGGGGGGGGGGGTIGYYTQSPPITGFTLSGGSSYTGGNAGNGGSGDSGGTGSNVLSGFGGGGGGGGAGGDGVYLLNGSVITSSSNAGTITGGTGGSGGNGGDGGPTALGSGGGGGGGGGAGGDGVLVATANGSSLTNSGIITGGNGGNGGTGGADGTTGYAGNGAAGGGGIGVALGVGTLTNSGTITGGLSYNGATRGDAVYFDANGSTPGSTLVLEAGSSITGNVVVNFGGGILILGGSTNSSFDVSQIGGSAQYQGFTTFEKTGSSTWTLTNTNSGTTPWTITAGTLNVSSDAALGASTGTLTLDGGTLQWGAAFNSARAITLGSSGGTLDTNSFSSTLSGVISGTGGLTKTGTGTLTLSGTNTYTGTTTINAGTINASADAALGASTGTLTLNGGTLQWGAAFNSARAITLGSGGGTLDTNSFSSTLSGVISGTGGLTKTGTGTLTLSSSNTYSGGTTVSAGTLQAEAANALSSSSAVTVASGATLDLNNYSQTIGSLAGAGSVTLGSAILTDGGDNSSTSFSGVISGTGGLTKTGTGTLTLSGPNTYTGATTINAGTINASADAALGATSGGLALNGGTLQWGAAFNSARAITLGSGGGTLDTNSFSSTLSGVISGTTGLTKTGTGTLTLSGTNTYSGGTAVSAGTLSISSNGNLGSGGTVALQNGTTLAFTAGGTYSHAITVTGDPTFDVASGQTVTQSGVIADGSTAGDVTKTGSGTLVLAGANTYTGGTTVSAGTLQLSGSGTLGSTSSALAVDGGTLDLGGASQTVGSLAGTGGAIALGSGTLTVNQSTDTTYAGAISGTGGLTKTGTGTLILDGVNTYTGGTTVAGGMLEVGDINTPSARIAGNVTVDSSGTLRGHGTVGGSVTNDLGGIVAPGGTIGTLTLGGNYTQGSNSTLSIEVSPSAASKLEVAGSATLAGTLKLVYDPGVYSAKTYDIVHAGSISGTFATVTGNTPSGFKQSLAYTATDVNLSLGSIVIAPTNDTVFTALGTAALLGGQATNGTILGHLAGFATTGGGMREAGLAAPAPVEVAMAGQGDFDGFLNEAPAKLRRLGGWFQARGSFARLNGSGGAAGFGTSSGGFLAGLDRPVGRRLRLGLAAGYSHTDVSVHDGESGSLDTPRVAVYGSYAFGRIALDATAGYAHEQIDAARPVAALGETATSGHAGGLTTAALQAEGRVDLDGVRLVPAAGLEYAHLYETGFAESGSPGFDLAVSGRNSNSLRPFAGVSAAKRLTGRNGLVWMPHAAVRYSYETMNAVPPSMVQVGGGSFTVNGIQPSRGAVTVDAGVDARLGKRLAFKFNYGATLPTGNYANQTLEAGLTYLF